ncbi:MAG: transglycosylase SLT domain-containing protein [Myxococcota bacterium]
MPWRKMGTTIILSMTLISLTCTAQEPIPSGVILDPQPLEEPELIWHVWPQSMLDANPQLSPSLVDALRIQDWGTGLQLLESQLAEHSGNETALHASLRLWMKLHHNTKGLTAADLNGIDKSPFPQDYKDWMKGTALLALDNADDGIQTLNLIGTDSTRYAAAQRALAQHYASNAQKQEEIHTLEALLSIEIPAVDRERALIRLSQLYPPSAELYRVLRDLWTDFPASKSGQAASKRIASFKTRPEYKATDSEKVARTKALMNAYRFDTVIKEHRTQYSSLPKNTTANCQLWYAFGRSLYKKNQITEGARVLTSVGQSCKALSPVEGAKAYYLAGKCLERKKQWLDAANRFQQIPTHYPEHSMGDDGYALAGVAYQIAGNDSLAQHAWESQVQKYPDGDLLAEGYWRLAWSAYLKGEPEKALKWSEAAISHFNQKEQHGYSHDPVHRLAQSYWHARWTLYPDVNNPEKRTSNQDDIDNGINALKHLCETHPTEFYALLAAQRLYELEPDYVPSLKRPQWLSASSGWHIPEVLHTHPQIQKTLSLIQIGLVQDALNELRKLPSDLKSPTVAAIDAHLESQFQPIIAHDRLHRYLKSYVIAEIPDNRGLILKTAYPNTYWEETQVAADGYSYDGRIFHALIREESSFNKDIVSWAGAKGLSQLMPATAKRVAGWLSMSINSKTIFDPLTNLKIGARYLEYLHGFFNGNSFMAVGAYNAGEGNMQKWYKAFDNPPTDELIESVPIRETRGYIKRVLGTYQNYSAQHGTNSLFPDWSKYNHQAKQ